MSEEYEETSILVNLCLFEWNFQIPIQYSQPNMVKLSCIAFSVEQARKLILAMFTKFEKLSKEKESLEQERKKQDYRGTTYFNYEIKYLAKLKQMYQCDITYQHGCRDSSIDPRDYTKDMKVQDHYSQYTLHTISLEDFIKTTEPQIKTVNLLSFEVGN